MKALSERINDVLNQEVRPYLKKHNGDVVVDDFEDGILTIRLLGQCATCALASDTVQGVIENPLLENIPEIKEVILSTGISDEMMALAKTVLSGGKLEF